MIKKIALILLLLSSFAYAKFKNCEGHDEVIKMNMPHCADHENCPMFRGKNFTFNGFFVAKDDSKNVDIKISFHVEGVEPIPINGNHGCGNVPCPLIKNGIYHFAYEILVPNHLPDGNSTVTSQFYNAKGFELACFHFTVMVTDEEE